MADQRCRRRPAPAPPAVQPIHMETREPMNRYINPHALFPHPGAACPSASCSLQNQVLLEQLVELSIRQNQLLIDVLGAVNSLTAALLTARAQV